MGYLRSLKLAGFNRNNIRPIKPRQHLGFRQQTITPSVIGTTEEVSAVERIIKRRGDLKMLREELGLKPGDFARISNGAISHSTYTAIERGKTKYPILRTVIVIAEVMKISMDQITIVLLNRDCF